MFEKIFAVLDKNIENYTMERMTSDNVHEYFILINNIDKETFDFLDKCLIAEEKGIYHKQKYAYFTFEEKGKNGIEYLFYFRCFNCEF